MKATSRDFTAKEAKVGQTLEVTLKYGPNGERSIQGYQAHLQAGPSSLREVRLLPMPLGGLGIAIISTSSGLLTQKECLDRGIGGKLSPSCGEKGELETWHRILVSSPSPSLLALKSRLKARTSPPKGAKGSDSYVVPEGITAAVEGNEIVLTAADDLPSDPCQSTVWLDSIMAGMVKGVHDGYSKTLEIVGTGLPRRRQGDQGIEFFLGYSPPITVNPPEGITLKVTDANHVVVEGTDKRSRGPGCRQHPQAARSGTLQGQGHQVLR